MSELSITIEEHEGMEGVVLLTCGNGFFQFNDTDKWGGPWFKIPSNKGPTFIECDNILQALKIVKGIMGVIQ